MNDGVKPTGWITDSAWSVDANAPRSGVWSLRLTDAPSVPFAQIARQTLTLAGHATMAMWRARAASSGGASG